MDCDRQWDPTRRRWPRNLKEGFVASCGGSAASRAPTSRPTAPAPEKVWISLTRTVFAAPSRATRPARTPSEAEPCLPLPGTTVALVLTPGRLRFGPRLTVQRAAAQIEGPPKPHHETQSWRQASPRTPKRARSVLGPRASPSARERNGECERARHAQHRQHFIERRQPHSHSTKARRT